VNKIAFFAIAFAVVLLLSSVAYPASEAQQRIWQGDKYAERQEFEKAIKEYRAAAKLNPPSDDVYYKMAAAYHKLAYKNLDFSAGAHDQLLESIDCYKKVISINPRYVEAYNDIGFAYNCLMRQRDAIPYLEKAIELDPEMVAAYNNLGASYIDLNAPEKALPYLEKALQMDPDYWRTHYNIGVIYFFKGENAKAKENFEKAKKMMGDEGNKWERRQIDEFIKKMH
jgi:superkiller protein 3